MKYFSTEAAAKEYVDKNKPQYSLSQVEEAMRVQHIDPDGYQYKGVVNLLKYHTK